MIIKRYLLRFFALATMLEILVALNGCQKYKDVNSSSSKNTEEITAVELMKNGCGAAVTQLDSLSEESLKLLKESGITFIKVHIPYPFASDGTLTTNYMTAKRAVKMIYNVGLEPVCQSFTPGGNAYNSSTGKVEWMSYLPNVFEDYDDAYFYKVLRNGTEYIAKDLKEYTNCWIVSNEPNLTVFTGPMTFEQIQKYITTCAEGLKSGNPSAYCGVNIFASADKNRAMRLIPMLYGENSALDYLGLDSYFGTLVEGGAESWDDYIYTYYNMTGVPIMITEFSYSSYVYEDNKRQNDSTGLAYNNAVCRDKRFSCEWDNHLRNEETQAEYARACLKIFKQHKEVIGWCWFSNIDKTGPCWECGDTNCPMESSWGLLRSDGTAKPVLNMFSTNQ